MTVDPASCGRVRGPDETSRLIPSRFPPVPLFETVASADDLETVFELEGWTNDRLVETRLLQLDRREWVYGRPNASVIMASFLHGSPAGLRFSSGSLGAWYASTHLQTAMLEVANGLRKEIAASALTRKTETYRQYKARLPGSYVDIFGRYPDFHDPDERSYPTPQAFGERVRDEGPALGISGIRYESVRRRGYENWVCFRPTQILDVVQAGHFELDVPATGKVVVRTLA